MLHLRNREIGQISGHQAMKCYFQTKLSSMQHVLSLTHDIENEIEDLEYIKGGKNFIYCIWRTKKENPNNYILYQVMKRHLQPRFSGLHYVVDMHVQDLAGDFFGSGNSFLFVGNDEYGESTIYSWWHNNSTYYNLYWRIVSQPGPLFCVDTACGSTPGNEKLIVGGDSVTVVGDLALDGTKIHEKPYDVDGRTMTASFDNTRNVFLSGQSNGSVYIYDCRMSYPAYCTKLFNGSDTCIVDSLHVEHHENEFILANADNKLCTFDLRIMKPSVHFFGHTHALKKRPFSLANELLCVSGGDNVVRIWHSSGGLPLHEIKPDFPENQLRGWLTAEGVKSDLYLFEREKMNVFQID